MVLIIYFKLFRWKNFFGRSLCLVNVKGPGGGELFLSACLGMGNRTSSAKKKKSQIPGGMSRGGGGGGRGEMVTARIELNHS